MNVRTKQMQMSKTSNLARRQKNKHIRYEFLDTEELPIILFKKQELNSLIKGYHTYMILYDEMGPKTRRISYKARLEPENEFDKCAVAVEKYSVVLGQGKTG